MRVLFLRQTRGKSKQIADLSSEYMQRCRGYAQVDSVEPKARGNADTYDPPGVWNEPSTRRVVLDERGKQFSSQEMAEKFRKWKDDPAVKTVAFYVGGPFGVPANMADSAHEKWSLSKGTLPSDLAWLVLTEQVYRALSILGGSPYHHD